MKTLRKSFLLIFYFVALGLSESQLSANAQTDILLSSVIKQTVTLMQKGDYSHAIIVCKNGLKKFPHSADLLCKASLASIYLESENEAIDFRDRALREPGLTVQNFIELNKVSREAEDYQKALQITRLAVKQFPSDPSLPVCLAENLRSLEKYNESRSLFRQHLLKNPGNLGTRLDEMDCSRELGDWAAIIVSADQMEKAIAKNKAVRQSVIYGRCMSAKGNAHFHLQQYPQARDSFEKALLAIPVDRPTLNAHMKTCRILNDQDAVKKDQVKLAEFDKGL